jgi:hypothetical protein
MKNQKINHLAIWVLSILVQPLPMIWYNDVVYGIRWRELNNLTEEDFANFNPVNFIWAFASAVVLGYILAYLFKRMDISSAVEALKLATLLWFGLLFLELATQNAFTLRVFELTLLDTLVVLFKYEIMAIGIFLWKKKSKD